MFMEKSNARRFFSFQLLRFIVSGSLATTTYYFVAMVSHYACDLHVSAANTIAYAIGFCISYIMQKYWTFENVSGHKKTLPLFVLASFIGFLINSAIILCGDMIGFAYYCTSFVAIIVMTCVSYIMQSKVVFRKR